MNYPIVKNSMDVHTESFASSQFVGRLHPEIPSGKLIRFGTLLALRSLITSTG